MGKTFESSIRSKSRDTKIGNEGQKNQKRLLEVGIHEGVQMYKDARDEKLPESFMSMSDFLKGRSSQELRVIYAWYRDAMVRRDREPLDEDSFFNVFFEFPDGSVSIFGTQDQGYLIGNMRAGVFMPSHFAPKTLRKGYELLKDLGKSNLQTLLFITDDLATTIEKMPEWRIEPYKIPSVFRGEFVQKSIAHNRIPNFDQRFEEYIKSAS